MNCHTLKISEYIDYHLQPIVKEIPSYIQDTTDFLRKINQIDIAPNNSYLASLNVKSLYTNIPNVEGMKSVKTSLEKYFKQKASNTINFIFNCKNYLQIKGCAMENLFTMRHRKFVYPFIKTFSLIYLRLIDDIFFIWTGSETDLEKF